MHLLPTLITLIIGLLANFCVAQESTKPYFGELEGGANTLIRATAATPYEGDDFNLVGQLGYSVNLLTNIRTQRYNLSKNYLFFGIGLGQTRGRFTDLSLVQTASVNQGVDPVSVRQQESTLEIDARYFSLSMGFTVHLYKELSFLLGVQIRQRTGGQIRYAHRITTTHFFDPSRGLYIPLPTALETQSSTNFSTDNSTVFLLGLAYRGFSPRFSGKLIFSFDGRAETFPFRTVGLQLLAGYRL
ncbi:MAG: hypothetical protein AAGF89_10470 [Bacteroidota bacterium]